MMIIFGVCKTKTVNLPMFLQLTKILNFRQLYYLILLLKKYIPLNTSRYWPGPESLI